MSNTVLCVFEGEAKEPSIFKNLESIFLKNQKNTILHGVYGAEIFQLWKEVEIDQFLDIVALLQHRFPDQLVGIRRQDVSEVFLFFDHDGHSHLDKPDYHDSISRMVRIFCESTDLGKLYISYPMVEATFDASCNLDACFDCMAYVLENVNYKKNVGARSSYSSNGSLGREEWLNLFKVNIIKAGNLISWEGFIDPDIKYDFYKTITQEKIANAQGKLYGKTPRRVIVLSGIPFFVIDFCNDKIFDELVGIKMQKGCNYFCLPEPF